MRTAGVATVAFDAFGCGSSAKPRDPLAYAPGELYADLEAIYKEHCKVSKGHAGKAEGVLNKCSRPVASRGWPGSAAGQLNTEASCCTCRVLHVPSQRSSRQAKHKHL